MNKEVTKYNKMFKPEGETSNINDVPVEDAGHETPIEEVILNTNKKKEEVPVPTPAPVPAAPIQNPIKEGVIVGAPNVNLRSRPSMGDTPVVKILTKDTLLDILEDKKDEFYKVKLKTGEIGYVKDEFVKIR